MMYSFKSTSGLTRTGEVNKTVRIIWTCSFHCYAGIQEEITNLTDIKCPTSEPRVELGASRCG